MNVYLILRDHPNKDRLLFCKTTKDQINRALPMVGLLTELQVQQIGGWLLTMAKDDKVVLHRCRDDLGMEFMRVERKSRLDNPFIAVSEVLAEIDRTTDFVVQDYYHKDRVTYFQSRESAEFVPAAVHDEVHMGRYALCWDMKVGPMPLNTQLFARQSDVAKLSGNVLQQAGFKVHSVDDRTGTLLMTQGGSDKSAH